jgi:hypothetical protein
MTPAQASVDVRCVDARCVDYLFGTAFLKNPWLSHSDER